MRGVRPAKRAQRTPCSRISAIHRAGGPSTPEAYPLRVCCCSAQDESSKKIVGFRVTLLGTLHALGGWVPDQFVNLQAKAGGDIVGQDPLRQVFRVEQAVRRIASARRVFAEGGREQYGGDSPPPFFARRPHPAPILTLRRLSDQH